MLKWNSNHTLAVFIDKIISELYYLHSNVALDAVIEIKVVLIM